MMAPRRGKVARERGPGVVAENPSAEKLCQISRTDEGIGKHGIITLSNLDGEIRYSPSTTVSAASEVDAGYFSGVTTRNVVGVVSDRLHNVYG